MPFKPGQSGNPAGKKPGTHRKTTPQFEAALAKIRAERCRNGEAVRSRDLLDAMVSHTALDLTFRKEAAALLLPYDEVRKARYIEHAIELPVPATVEQATENIAKLQAFAAAKTIGLDEMNDLIGAQKSYIEAKIGLDIEGQMLELRQIVEKLSASARPVDAVILGGLPSLPGTTIDMRETALGQPANGGYSDPESGSSP